MSQETDATLPPGWVLVPIELLAEPTPHALSDGPFGSNLKTSHYTQAGPRVIRLQNIAEGRFVDDKAHISEEHYSQLLRHAVEPEDVLIALLGDPPARACLAPRTLGKAIVKADCVRLRVNRSVALPAYVMHGLNSEAVKRRLTPLVHGVGRPRINLRSLREVEVPIAPPPEQVRIVEAIEEEFSKLDAAVSGLGRAQANLKRYRAAVLKAAVEGRLVPTEAELARQEGRDYEPAKVLLDRILKERRRRWEETAFERLKTKGKAPTDDRWKAKYKEPVVPETEDLPELPEGWCWGTLAQLAWDSSYGTSKKCSYHGTGEAVLRIPNIQDGRPVLDDLKRATVPLGVRHTEFLAPGDFLVIRTNGSRNLIARAAFVREPLSGPHFFASYLIRFRLVLGEHIGPWLLTLWHSPEMRRELESKAATSAGQYNVSQTALLKRCIPLPPAAEQQRIETEVERLMSVAGAVRKSISEGLTRCERLGRSVLSCAFSGRLVDHDPGDESAVTLLTRIREQSEDGNAASRKRGQRGKRK